MENVNSKATAKQIRYAFSLMQEAGIETRYMGSSHKKLGAKMHERSGTVENWLQARNIAEMSEIIETLQGLK